MTEDMRSRVENILNSMLGTVDPADLLPAQSRVEAILMALDNKIDELGDLAGKLPIHICTSSEYNQLTGIPTIADPEVDIFYLVPDGSGNDLYTEWIYTGDKWEYIGGKAQSADNSHTFIANRVILNTDDDANNITQPGSYVKPLANTVYNIPSQSSGYLYVFSYGSAIYQMYQTGNGNLYYRQVGKNWNWVGTIGKIDERIGAYAVKAKQNKDYTENLTWESGTYSPATGEEYVEASYIRTVSGISVDAVSSIRIYHTLDTIMQDGADITPSLSVNAFLYHGDNYIERLTGALRAVGVKSCYAFDVNGKYGEVRLSFKRSFGSGVTPSSEYKTPVPTDIDVVVVPAVESRLRGKTIIGIGDSLIYGQGLSENQRNNCTWLAILRDRYGMTAYNYGASGTPIASIGDYTQTAISARIDAVITAHSSEQVDYFVVEGGANDYSTQSPLGVLSRDNIDTSTYYGALNTIINKIKSAWPKVRILLMTNYDRKVRGDSTLNDETYVNAMLEFARARGIPIFDNYHELGVSIRDYLNPDTSATGQDQYLDNWFFGKTESQHLTVDAFEWVAPVYAKKLESI